MSDTDLFTFYSVPDQALRRGDFSNAMNANGTLQGIYDPMSAILTAPVAGRTLFPGNVIPANRIHPIARTILDTYYPLPNVEGSGAGGLTNNYRMTQRNTTDRHNFDGKVNWNRTSANQIWGKVSHMDARVNDRHVFPFPTTAEAGAQTDVFNYATGQTWTVGSTLTMDGSLGYATMMHERRVAGHVHGHARTAAWHPEHERSGAGRRPLRGPAAFQHGIQRHRRRGQVIPTTRDDSTLSGSFNLTKAGQHELKAGYSTTYMTLEHWNPEGANPRGQFDFATNATRTFGTGAQTGNFYNQQ